MTEAMLVFILQGKLRETTLLLGEKTARYCKGKLVAPGGRVEEGEDVRTAAVRETMAECGLLPILGQMPLGTVVCHNPGSLGDIRISIFRTRRVIGAVRDSDELIKLAWYPIHAIPYDRLMEGDRNWIGYVIRNKPFEAEVWYDKDWRVVRDTIRPL